jgi:hypothetical protein
MCAQAGEAVADAGFHSAKRQFHHIDLYSQWPLGFGMFKTSRPRSMLFLYHTPTLPL